MYVIKLFIQCLRITTLFICFILTIQDLSGGVRVYTIQVLCFSLVKGDNDVNPKLFVYFTMMNYFIYVPYKCILFIV